MVMVFSTDESDLTPHSLRNESFTFASLAYASVPSEPVLRPACSNSFLKSFDVIDLLNRLNASSLSCLRST